MKELILDFAKWRAGGYNSNRIGTGRTLLLNNEGYMCCLGQFSLQLKEGLSKEEILNQGTPGQLNCSIEDLTNLKDDEEYGIGIYNDSRLSSDAMQINDNAMITTDERIQQLTELFAQYDYKIVVINRPESQ